jgi:hypothetical protein
MLFAIGDRRNQRPRKKSSPKNPILDDHGTMMPQSRRFAIGLLVSATALGGCQKISVWMTQSLQKSAPQSSGTVSITAASATGGPDSAVERDLISRRNAELLQEIYRVVLVTNPSSPATFGNWLDSMNQGATLEGIYNGFTRSDYQRSLESDRKTTADPKVIRVFSQELAELLLEFPKVPDLEPADAKPFQSIQQPGAGDEGRTSEGVEYSRPTEESFRPFAKTTSGAPVQRPDPAIVMGRVGALFAGSSIFTMKRVLGDWALRVIALRLEESPERMRDWYADFAAHASKKGVDFGLGLRNESSREFHRKWAEQATDDQIRWEVLNRLHRILNAAQGLSIRS